MEKTRGRRHSRLLLLIPVLLILCGVVMIGHVLSENRQMEQEALQEVKKFEQSVIPAEEHIDDNLIEASPETEQADEKESVQLTGDAIGVLYIPAFDHFAHLIAMGVSRAILDWYVGMYESYARPGKEGNCVLAAHSNVLPGKQAYSYFNRIESYVKTGDSVSILWQDGFMYSYYVTDVFSWISKKDEKKYLNFDTGGNEYLTLQTCTNGNSDYRTFIRCIRSE